MIDFKFVLHDMFNDTSVNFLCTYPLLYTAGLCDVRYIGVYTCLHGRCFLSALYNNLPRVATVNASLCLVTQVHTRMPLLEAVHYAHTNVTLLAEIQRASYLLVQRTHATSPLLSFGRPMLRIFYFQSTELGRSWTWSAPWNATRCHVFLLRMDNQFANEKPSDIFVRHFAATRFVDKKCV